MNDKNKDYREQFKPTEEEFKSKDRVLQWIFVPVIIGAWLVMAISGKHNPEYQMIGFAIFFTGSISMLLASWLWLPKLDCPGCHADLDTRDVGPYCPECGSEALVNGWFFYKKCTNCGKALVRGRGGRRYKVRYCTKCDGHVSDKGL